MPKPSDLLQGTLDLLILKTVAREPVHGWGISKRIQLLSGDTLSVGQGSLYPALHRLEQQGWIRAEWKASDLGRDAKHAKVSGRDALLLHRRGAIAATPCSRVPPIRPARGRNSSSAS